MDLKKYRVTIQQIAVLNPSTKLVRDRRFIIRAKTADKARQTVENAGHAGRIVAVEKK